MSSYHTYQVGKIWLGASVNLSASAQVALVDCFHGDSEPGQRALAGRAPVQHAIISGIGPVVIKQYVRGGLLRYFRSTLHLRKFADRQRGGGRSEREFRVLELVRALGIPAPEPIAFAWRGGGLYRAWLVTRQIEGHRTLAEVSRHDGEKARILAKRLVPLLEQLIRNGIFHVDLHPGNVVVDANDQVFLLDFDKARIVSGREHEHLAERYLRRWRRAVIKHQLSEALTEVVCSSLRRRDLVSHAVSGEMR